MSNDDRHSTKGGHGFRAASQSPGELDAARMRQVLELLPFFATLLDRERRLRWVNRLAPGARWDQVQGQPLEVFLHESTVSGAIDAFERALRTGEVAKCDTRRVRHTGEETRYETTIIPLPDPEPDGVCAVLLSLDVTQRFLAERALKESEHRFRLFTEASPDTILIVDREHRILYSNRNPPAASGATLEDMLGRRIAEVTHADDIAHAEEAIERALATGEAGTYEVRGGVSGRHYLNRVMRLPGEAGQGAQALIAATDVTEQRRAEAERAALEAQLQQAQKLETVGRLAGGVAHDFNNVLLVIQSNLEFAMASARGGGDVMPELEAIAAAADRASSMTRRLLTIGRRQLYAPTVFDLATFVRDTMNLLARMMPESIEIELDRANGPLPVRADATQLEQVLINLCLNAKDAIVGVGKIRVAVSRADSPLARGAGDWFALSVSDTGTGMDEQTVARLFEPFFTTKAPGKGTGLGLSMVQSIVNENGGTVNVRTESGKGTTFTVLLPKAGEHLEETPVPVPTTQERGHRGTRILLAEDEPGVRAVVVRILERAGYSVIEAKDGREAVDLFKEYADSIELVLLDAVMPILGGKDAYDEIVSIRADVPVLFSSGYAAEVLPAAFLASRRLKVLSKPYRPAALLSAVRQTLESSARK